MTEYKYDYNIYPEYDIDVFNSTVSTILNNGFIKGEYLVDPLDGDQMQIFVKDGEEVARLDNNFMIGAVFVRSNVPMPFLNELPYK
jgi:hypothetical protein